MTTLPAEWPVVEVRVGPYFGTDGRPLEGARVTFEPRVKRLLLLDETTIVRRITSVTLDENGEGVVELPVSDDPDISNTGWTWQVREKFPWGQTYDIDVLTADVAAGIDLADRAPVVSDEARDSWMTSFREEMEDLRDEVDDLANIDTPDALVADLISNPASATGVAAAATIGEVITKTGATEGQVATYDATLGKFKPGTPAAGGSTDGPLSRWLRKLGDDPANAKIVFSGDSTTEGATQMYGALRIHRARGAEFDGMASANFVNHGNTGFGLADFKNHTLGVGGAPVPVNTWAATVAAAPHLIVASWGINDVRGGGTTEAQMRALLVWFIEKAKADLPNTDLVLRIPNPMVTTGGSFISGITAEEANRRIREAYLSLIDSYAHVQVIDTSPVFGTATLPTSWIMSDQLHPTPQGHWFTGHYLATKIGLPGRTPPKMGPPSRYVRTGYVNLISTTQLHIDSIEWAGGAAVAQNQSAWEWIIDSTSTIYTSGGATSLSGVTKSTTGTQTLVLTKTGFDWATVAAAGEMVQIVGHHAPEGLQGGVREYFVDPPSLAAGGYAAVDVATSAAVLGRGVVVLAPTSLPAGLMWSARVKAAGTLEFRFFNASGSTVDAGSDLWRVWFVWG